VTTQEISVQELDGLGPSVRVIDVREPNEWADGHIAHARLVPLATVPDHIDVFEGERTYVVCRSGGRSGQACGFLGEKGYDVVNVAGGMLAWSAAGLEVASGTDAGATGG
jgi:rhodanese-related sulfurtransferase